MKKLSLKLKVTLWYTLVMLLLSSVVLIAISSIGRDMLDRDISERLVKTVSDFSMFYNGRGKHMRPLPLRGFYVKGVHVVVFNESGEIIEGQMPFGISSSLPFLDNELRKETYDGNLYFVYDRKTKPDIEGNIKWIKGMVAINTERMVLSTVMRNNLILTLFLIVFAAFGGYFIISRAFVPVNKIMKTAKEISESSDLSRRIHIGKGTDEIHELANTFDEMLEKIEQSFEKEKQFTSDASHELRTPVAVIMSECDYISECIETDNDLKESTDSIRRQAEKMSKLISELLTISRMDRNTIKTSFEKTNLSEILSFVCDEQEEINSGDIVLERQISENVFAIADTGLIARMFINLISNAYQYSKSEGRITVCLNEIKDRVVFEVKDEGVGIEKDDIPKIFERFYQVDNSRTSKENGSMGLGLAMVKWICECHGGIITVESEPGKGSIFKVEIPKNL